jgi:hypothetical protein
MYIVQHQVCARCWIWTWPDGAWATVAGAAGGRIGLLRVRRHDRDQTPEVRPPRLPGRTHAASPSLGRTRTGLAALVRAGSCARHNHGLVRRGSRLIEATTSECRGAQERARTCLRPRAQPAATLWAGGVRLGARLGESGTLRESQPEDLAVPAGAVRLSQPQRRTGFTFRFCSVLLRHARALIDLISRTPRWVLGPRPRQLVRGWSRPRR